MNDFRDLEQEFLAPRFPAGIPSATKRRLLEKFQNGPERQMSRNEALGIFKQRSRQPWQKFLLENGSFYESPDVLKALEMMEGTLGQGHNCFGTSFMATGINMKEWLYVEGVVIGDGKLKVIGHAWNAIRGSDKVIDLTYNFPRNHTSVYFGIAVSGLFLLRLTDQYPDMKGSIFRYWDHLQEIEGLIAENIVKP